MLLLEVGVGEDATLLLQHRAVVLARVAAARRAKLRLILPNFHAPVAALLVIDHQFPVF